MAMAGESDENNRRVHVITTTINEPVGLLDYAANAAAHGHPASSLTFVVTGDKKTPSSARACVAGITERYGYAAVYLGVEEQECFLSSYPELDAHVPWNCIQRRNVSLLWAYEHGADVIITIDDDNFVTKKKKKKDDTPSNDDGRSVAPTTTTTPRSPEVIVEEEEDFVGKHCVVGTTQTLDAFVDGTPNGRGWVNVCAFLNDHKNVPFYHRGYPMHERWRADEVVKHVGSITTRVAVNAGLWFEDPDVDAVTRLTNDIVAVECTRDASFALQPGPNAWSPFNSQNTAVCRDVLEAYWMCPCVGRMDDIWPSYVVRRIADHLGDAVAYGFPIVTQERNPHDLFRDLDDERLGMRLGDDFCAALKKAKLTGTTYGGCLAELATQMREWVDEEDWEGGAKGRWGGGDGRCGAGEGTGDGWGGKGGGKAHRAFVEGFVESMVVWGKTMQRAKARVAKMHP